LHCERVRSSCATGRDLPQYKRHDLTGIRANHVRAAIARHKRADRIEERDGKLSAAVGAL
jgi:hypothetical protein